MSTGMISMTEPYRPHMTRVGPPALGGMPEIRGTPRPMRPLLSEQAALWKAHGFPDGLLLQGEALASSEAWATRHVGELQEEETDFLQACREARTCAERQRRLAGLERGCLVAAAIAGLVILRLLLQARATNQELAASMEAVSQRLSDIAISLEEAEARATLEATWRDEALRLMAERRSATAPATSSGPMADRDRQLGFLLALEALLQSPEEGWNMHGEATISILRALTGRGWQSMPISPSRELPTDLAWKSAGWLLLTHPGEGDPIVWDELAGERLAALSGCGPLRYAAWSPDGEHVITLGRDGAARIWTANGDQLATLPSDGATIHAVWHSDNRRVATLDRAGEPALWDGHTGERLEMADRETVVAWLVGLLAAPMGDLTPTPCPEHDSGEGRPVDAYGTG